MNAMQRFFKTILPQGWADSMEAESRSWMVRCSCGFERSIWDLGGIRWKAKGNPRRFLACPHCQQAGWHTIYRKREGETDQPQ